MKTLKYLFKTVAIAIVFIFSSSFASPVLEDSYDFIVVGGGVGGCVTAGRLSEDGRYNVLLLEAGGVPSEDMDVPVKAPDYQVNPEVTFQYKSVPQRNASLAYDGIVSIPLGRVLGGTSSINYMFFNRGHPKDYDNWANITEDSEWAYSNMLKYFVKMEDYSGSFPSDQHGIGGVLPITNQSYAPGLETWLEAGRTLGYDIADPNGPQRISFTPIEYNKKNGRRMSSYNAYIKPFQQSRSNLKIITNAVATELIFEGDKVTGVKYNSTYDGQIISVFASKEVILSAGAYGSAILLMKSGIGPRDVLEEAGIPLRKELPVGNNLQDHPIIPTQLVINNKSLLFDPEVDLTPENWELFEREGTGPYTTTAGLFAQNFISSTVAQSEGEGDWPDIQFSMYAQKFFTALPNTSLGGWETPIYAYPYLGRQKSVGTVKLNPNDVNGQPLIDFNYLSDSRDVQITVEIMQMTMRILEQTVPYQFIGARYPPDSLPACQHLAFRSDDYWACYVRQMLVGGNHPVGTCKMGKVSDPQAVVDSKLRVIGVEGLRVIDGSIMPVITNANVQAAIFAIGEKGADDILKHWNILK